MKLCVNRTFSTSPSKIIQGTKNTAPFSYLPTLGTKNCSWALHRDLFLSSCIHISAEDFTLIELFHRNPEMGPRTPGLQVTLLLRWYNPFSIICTEERKRQSWHQGTAGSALSRAGITAETLWSQAHTLPWSGWKLQEPF